MWLEYVLLLMLSLEKYISQYKTTITEGKLRCAELNAYLEGLNLDKYVWLSEDATGIVTNVDFDPNSNQMVGLVLPTNQTTGMPIPFTYLARNAVEIQTNMRKRKSTHVYMVLAQPLKKKAPPFILQLFGTDNTFKANSVHLRWNNTINELKR